MNWEAAAAIGVLVVVLGTILLVPGLYWARREARKHRNCGFELDVGWPGVVVAAYVVGVGVGIPVAANFFPTSLVGSTFRGEWGGLLWWLVLLVPPYLLGKLLDHLRRRPTRGGSGAASSAE